MYANYKYLYTKHWPANYIKQILTDVKGEINSKAIIVGNFNTLSPMANYPDRE